MSKRITVIGTGYAGLIAAIGLADFGNEVICADINKENIENLNKGISPIYEQGIDEYLIRNLQNGKLKFTDYLSEAIKSSEVIFVGVGTPQLQNGEADLSQVEQVVDLIGDNLNSYKINRSDRYE